MQPNKARTDLWMDLALVAFLIAFDVAARLLPHAPGFLPVAASALFAGRMLRVPALALVVPVAAMVLSDFGACGRRLAHHAVVYCRDRAAGACRHAGAALARRCASGCRHGAVLADFLRRHRISRSGPSADVQPRLGRA